MFDKFKSIFTENLNQILRSGIILYQTNVNPDLLWELYLRSFPSGTDPFVKARTEHDCTSCKNFIRQYGGLVFIHNNSIRSIWRIDAPEHYGVVCETLSNFVERGVIKDIWATQFPKMGVDFNRSTDDKGEVIRWQHLFGQIPNSNKQLMSSEKIGEYVNLYRTSKEVLYRSLETITIDACQTVLELIDQNAIYRGAEFKISVSTFLALLMEYQKIPEDQRDCWVWHKSYHNLGVSKIRNFAIGTLLIDISENVQLDVAVKKFEAVVAPQNYKRPKPLVTTSMIAAAEKTIVELGYETALARRHAKLEDISVNDVLFVNRATRNKLKQSPILGLASTVKRTPKAHSKIQEISISDFLNNVLPHATEVEVLLENRHLANVVNLTAPVDVDAKRLFKWDNNFAWSYIGGMTDSIKENVKNAGGNVTGVLRFSIQWNENDSAPRVDLDAHAILPRGEINFVKRTHPSGTLDIDIRVPGNKVAVENIVFPTFKNMSDGKYEFFVHCFTNNMTHPTYGFRAQIEMDGEIYEYDYPTPLKMGERVTVAIVTLKNNKMVIDHKLNPHMSAKEFCGIHTGDWINVPIMCYSPNYWGENKAGNQHLFFMLEEASNPESTRGIFNEYLNNDLVKHGRVFELLGTKTLIPPDGPQMCGIGFSLTKRDKLVVRTTGAVQSVHQVLF